MNRTDERQAQEGIQETWLVQREETADQLDADSNSCQSLGSHLSATKHEQVRGNRNDPERRDRTDFRQREDDPGKILERLDVIETAFMGYVKGHQERLEVRLSESKAQEENLRKAFQELKVDVSNLLSKEKEEVTEE